jgi:4-methylaminobutanoate oxidase (formaldehyde-forming)
VVALGGEPLRIGADVVGRVTSGGYGYTVGASIAYAYLPAEESKPGTAVTVNVFGDWVAGRVVDQPLLDPKSTRVHADG